MRTLLVALLMGTSCGISLVSGQGFNRRYDSFGSGYHQGAWGIEPTLGGYVVFSGSYEPDTIAPDSVVGNNRIILTGIDGLGEVLWEKKHSVHQESIYLGWADCCDTVGGGYVSAGTIGGSDLIGSVRLMRYDADGDTLWVRKFGGPGESWVGSQVKHTIDDGFLVCGYTDAFGLSDAFALKVDATGTEQWRQHYGSGGGVPEDFNCIQAIEGGYLLAGSAHPTLENSDFYIVRIDGSGQEIWSTSFGGAFGEPSPAILLHSDGSLFLAGALKENDNGYERPYLAILDTSDGSIQWERNFGPALYSTTFFAVKECPNTDVIACGVIYQGSVERGMLLRATANGDSLWMRTYNYHDDVVGTSECRFWDMLPTEDGGFIATGFANGPFPPGYSQDAWVVKVDSMGCIVPGCQLLDGVTENVTNLGTALTLYPNPVHDVLHVGLQLPANYKTEGPLVLSVTSLDGKLVLQQAVPTSVAGEVLLEVGDLASGSYSIHLSDAHTWIAGKKFIIE